MRDALLCGIGFLMGAAAVGSVAVSFLFRIHARARLLRSALQQANALNQRLSCEWKNVHTALEHLEQVRDAQ